MSITDVLSAKDIDKAMVQLQAGNSFKPMKFLRDLGINKKSAAQVKKVFDFLDIENGGFIDYEEFLKMPGKFKPGTRNLTAAEMADFLKVGDPNNTGKISLDEKKTSIILKEEVDCKKRGGAGSRPEKRIGPDSAICFIAMVEASKHQD